MSTPNCEIIEELIPAYQIEALSAADGQLVAAHMTSCPRCQTLLQEYQPLAEALLYAAPLQRAPGHLDADFVRRLSSLTVATAADKAHPLPVNKVKPSQRLWIWPKVSPAWLAAGLAIVLLLALYAGQYRQNQALQGEIGQYSAIEQLLTSKNLDVIALKPSDGSVKSYGWMYFDRSRNVACVVVKDLPPLPADKAYQMWLNAGDSRVSAAVFQVGGTNGSAMLLIHAPQPLSAYTRTGITIEPVSGSVAPTTPRVIGNDF